MLRFTQLSEITRPHTLEIYDIKYKGARCHWFKFGDSDHLKSKLDCEVPRSRKLSFSLGAPCSFSFMEEPKIAIRNQKG